MIENFTKIWFKNLHKMRAALTEAHPNDYEDLVRTVITLLNNESTEYYKPDPNRITEIDHGDYQGTLVYVIASEGYQPSTYWYVKIGYGSCSGCDTLQAINYYSTESPNDKQVTEYMQLALHIIQELKLMGEDIV